ncbi:Testis-specific serine/threonine-protein kinase 5 [Galemys pyrenaicus]|uniref:non-specific serine/threonine protein kinase n=1 Tax=Galemys pyrenaicus TaxID=202257 RepID=A0A8J6A9J6_GALPY|nr:Testis-specific serine/threonine-protein kinase 5 [Galemys pyrenaicus]
MGPGSTCPMRGNGGRRLEQGTFLEQVRECRDRGYLLSSKIGSGAFSKVYLARATREHIQQNPRLASDLRGKRHTMVRAAPCRPCPPEAWPSAGRGRREAKATAAPAPPRSAQRTPDCGPGTVAASSPQVAIKIVSIANAPVEFSHKFLPREISSLNATYKHLNVVGNPPAPPCPRPAPEPFAHPGPPISGGHPKAPYSPLRPRSSAEPPPGARQVQLYETYQNSQRSYLVLELAARGDLLEHINAASDRRCQPGLDEEEARVLFWQLVSAVAHCHSSGVVHRDLKCENILLDDRGFLKLTDFGFASRVRLKSSLLSTFCGSVAYTAPEILMNRKYNGEQADLWSLGVILYTMVTGKLPFKERQPYCMLRLMRCGPTFQPGLSQECRDLIRGLLQLRPRARLGLPQVAAHRWMLPSAHALFRTVPRPAPEAAPPLGGAGEQPQRTAPDPHQLAETWCTAQKPTRGQRPAPCVDVDSDSPRELLQLRRPPRQDTPGENPWGYKRWGAGLPGLGALRQTLSLSSSAATSSLPGHALATE